MVADQPVGALYMYLYEERPFSELEQLMIDNLVNQAAIAISQIRRLAGIQRDLTRKEEELRHLRRAGLLISSRLQLDETLEAILQMALEVTGARYGIFRLMDREGQHLMTKAIAGEHLARPMVEELPIKEKSVMTWVALNRRPGAGARPARAALGPHLYPAGCRAGDARRAGRALDRRQRAVGRRAEPGKPRGGRLRRG